jgi:hypothetical protein
MTMRAASLCVAGWLAAVSGVAFAQQAPAGEAARTQAPESAAGQAAQAQQPTQAEQPAQAPAPGSDLAPAEASPANSAAAAQTTEPPAAPVAPPSAAAAQPSAQAEAKPGPPPPPPQTPIDPNQKRDVPDYDGREEPTTAGDVLLWIPRIVLSPLYVVSEFVIRRPLGYLISEAEFSNLPAAVYEFFTFGPNNEAGLIPIAFLDFGFEPSVGLYFWWDNAFYEGQDLRVRGSTWGEDWIAGSISSRTRFAKDSSWAIRISGFQRPDLAYFGEGASSLQKNRSRYGATTWEAEGEIDVGWGRASRITVDSGLRSRRFRDGDYDDDPTVRESVRARDFALPDKYTEGYFVWYNRILLALDSRRRRPAPGSGVRLELRAEQGSEIWSRPNTYLRYGGSLGAFYDLNDKGRVVSLYGSMMFADPLQGEVPFTELAQLGGLEAMRGFVPGRLYGRSAVALTLQYRWPVWVWLDGSIQLSIGNVFDKHLEDYKPELLRFSAAIGVESVGSRDSALEILFGLGSETFRHGGQINSFRLILGSHYGF